MSVFYFNTNQGIFVQKKEDFYVLQDAGYKKFPCLVTRCVSGFYSCAAHTGSVARWGARGESGLRNCERPPLAYFLQKFSGDIRGLLYNKSLFIPQIMPVLSAFPEEHLAFDQSVSFFECSDLSHFFIGQWVFGYAFQVADIIMYREWN